MNDSATSSAREPLTSVQPALPAAWYRDPVHYARELQVFWYGMWIVVAREEESAAAGDYRVIGIGTQSVLVVRGEDGSLRAFHNTCRHRGSILATVAQGGLAGRRIVCPYHGWTYDLEGRLAATPRRMPTPDFDPRQYPLYAVALDCWGGFVFVNLKGEDAPPLDESLGGLPQALQRHGLADLRIGKRIVLDVRANWKILAENFAECYHCPPVHPELCRIVTAYREGGAWGLHRDAAGQPLAEQRPKYLPGAATLTLDGSARIPPFRGLTPDERARIYMAKELRPNLFLNVQPDYLNTQMMFPTGPESVRMVYDWLFEPESLAGPGFDLEHYVALWDVTNRQDARNCEWQQQGLHALPFRHGHFMPQEFDGHRFSRWVRSALGGA
ncbi:MAG: aromatic ring-hydroxylating dioxygenase subunit alpha [Betaproteobacteria bacterium]|nr:aromatic ring-hydroxylating dioxygenase subunit alpha [Betaproteobacteria bacterium]